MPASIFASNTLTDILNILLLREPLFYEAFTFSTLSPNNAALPEKLKAGVWYEGAYSRRMENRDLKIQPSALQNPGRHTKSSLLKLRGGDRPPALFIIHASHPIEAELFRFYANYTMWRARPQHVFPHLHSKLQRRIFFRRSYSAFPDPANHVKREGVYCCWEPR